MPENPVYRMAQQGNGNGRLQSQDAGWGAEWPAFTAEYGDASTPRAHTQIRNGIYAHAKECAWNRTKLLATAAVAEVQCPARDASHRIMLRQCGWELLSRVDRALEWADFDWEFGTRAEESGAGLFGLSAPYWGANDNDLFVTDKRGYEQVSQTLTLTLTLTGL